MVTKVIWSPQAVEDLEFIRDFIGRDSPRYGAIVCERLLDAAERLADFPESGRVVPELGDPDIREVLWRDYRLVYRRGESRVEVVTVFHGALPLRLL